jgi:hypothetical protein
MADVKISALNSASTPLAGTETIPIVQSGETKKVAVSDILPTKTYVLKGSGGTLANNTDNTISYSALVPCEFTFYDLDFQMIKQGGGNATYRFYVNTTNSLSGATLMGSYVDSTASASGWSVTNFKRKLSIFDEGNPFYLIYPKSTASENDFANYQNGGAFLGATLPQNIYIIVAVQKADANDRSRAISGRIIKY